jgi:hypothetical protein
MGADRREFLGALIAAGLVPALDVKASPSVLPSFRPSVSPAWDLSWLDKLKGAHRAVFDCVQVNMGMGVLRACVWLKDYADVYSAQPADLNPVVVLRHAAIWLAMDDMFWEHHKLGAETKITDPATKAPIKRNPVLGPNVLGLPAAMADDSLKKVLAAGTVLACNLAFSLDVVPRVQEMMKLDETKAREMALQHIVPGIILQPSGVFATLRAQEAGCHYLLATDA